MEYKFIIDGKLPDLNDYLHACNRHYQAGATLKRENMDTVIWTIRQQLKRLHIDKPVRLHFLFVEANKKRDKDNVASFGHKVIQDALVKTNVINNDGWRDVVGFSDDFEVDSKNPRIEVTIKEVD